MSEKLKIEKNIPLPKTNMRGRYEIVGDMEVGDSLFIPGATNTLSCYLGMRFRPRKFSGRHTTVDGVNGYRIWRIA